MSQTTVDVKKEFQANVNLVRTLRDEVRVRLHLGTMDVKDEWKKLEPFLDELEHTATDFSDATSGALSEAVRRLTKLSSSLP